MFDFDITGSGEINMMTFGVCPGYGLAILHLEYLVDLSEMQEFAIVMKNPLKVHLSLR